MDVVCLACLESTVHFPYANFSPLITSPPAHPAFSSPVLQNLFSSLQDSPPSMTRTSSPQHLVVPSHIQDQHQYL